MKFSITVLCNCRFPSTAAHSGYLARLCDSLAGEGAEVELVVPKRFKESGGNPLAYYSVKHPFSIRKIWSFDFLILGRFLRRLAFPLQYANFYLFVLLYFLFRSRKRVIYTMDNLGPLLSFLGYRVIFETHIGIGEYRRSLLPILKKAERYVVVNSIIKNDFVKAGFSPEKILVAPNGVDLSLFAGTESKGELRKSFGLPENKKIIAYVGKYKTMAMDKGVDELVASFASAMKNHSDYHLLIVGLAEDEKAELVNLLDSASVPKEAFTLVAHVPQAEVARYIRLADVLVMNYPDTPYYANYMSPMKMFEYMASGNPIVATDLPSIREVLNESNAILVRPNDVKSLEEGIERAFNRSEIAAQALRDVESYTWDKRAKRILDFIG